MIVLSLLAACRAPAPVDVAHVVLPARGIGAHRGASETHPENTLAALRAAVALGVHLVEIDLRLTRDRFTVLMHDATVDRTTNGRGAVADLRYEDVRLLDAGSWKHRRFCAERVPTLEQALAVLPLNVWIALHLHGGAQLAEEVVTTLRAHRRLHQTFLLCGPTAAAAARRIEPQVMLCNAHRLHEPEVNLSAAVELRARFLELRVPHGESPTGSPHARQLGITTLALWQGGNRHARELLREVDFVLADDPEPLLHAARRFGIRPLQPLYP